MALYNEILQGRFANLLTRIFAMVGGGPAPQLAPEIQPGIDLNVSGSELDALAGTYWARASTTAVGTGVQFPHCGLLNPSGSGALCIIKGVDITCIAALATVVFGLQRKAGTLAVAAQQGRNRHLDTRVDGTGSGIAPIISAREGTDVDALGVNGVIVWQSAGVTDPRSLVHLDLTIVLMPGAYVSVTSDSNLATTSIFANWSYYYRTLTPQESQI